MSPDSIEALRQFIRDRADESWNYRFRVAYDEMIALAGTTVVDTQLLRWMAYPYFAHPRYRKEWLPL